MVTPPNAAVSRKMSALIKPSMKMENDGFDFLFSKPPHGLIIF